MTDTTDNTLMACKRSLQCSSLRLRYYVPSTYSDNSRVLVCVHGISRRANEHLELFKAYSERTGTLVVAPQFSKKLFRDYQCLGYRRSVHRADQALLEALDKLGDQLKIEINTFKLFGYSGGAQFSHRFAMLHPEKISGLYLGASGWYTFPNPEIEFPYGIKNTEKLFGVTPNLKKFLEIPIQVFVGEQDYIRDTSLNMAPIIDAFQGRHRVERARRWVDALNFFSWKNDLPRNISLHLIPDCGHSVASMLNSKIFFSQLDNDRSGS